jgi:hypothetical protein
MNFWRFIEPLAGFRQIGGIYHVGLVALSADLEQTGAAV